MPSLELPTASATAAPRPGLRSPPRRWLWPLSESPPRIPAHRTCWVLKLLNVLELAGDVFVTPSGQGPSSVPSAQEHGGPERGWGDQRTRPSGQWRPQEKPQGSLRPRFMWRLWAVEGGPSQGGTRSPIQQHFCAACEEAGTGPQRPAPSDKAGAWASPVGRGHTLLAHTGPIMPLLPTWPWSSEAVSY